MKKEISFLTKGQRADIGVMTIYRMLDNKYVEAVGPFVFLDHIVPKIHTYLTKGGTGAHPHRGIATLSYILNEKTNILTVSGTTPKCIREVCNG